MSNLLITILLLLFASCSSNGGNEIYYIPRNFKGPVIIATCGAPLFG